MKRRKTLIIIILIVLAGLIWWWLSRRDQAESRQEKDDSLIYDRLWIDKKPKLGKEYIHALMIVEHLPVGVFQKASAYRLEMERFDYRMKKSVIDLRLPQSEHKARVRYRIWACKDLPPYDLCLSLDKHPMEGPLRFFGMRNPDKGGSRHGAMRDRLRETLQRQ